MLFSQSHTTNRILSLLALEPKLTTKQVFDKLRVEGNQTTYQNIHKKIRALEASGIITRGLNCSGGYWLSREWVLSLEIFVKDVNRRQSFCPKA